jgi:hypothetical protein
MLYIIAAIVGEEHKTLNIFGAAKSICTAFITKPLDTLITEVPTPQPL